MSLKYYLKVLNISLLFGLSIVFFLGGGREIKMGWYKYFLSLLDIMIATCQTTVTVVFLRVCLNM